MPEAVTVQSRDGTLTFYPKDRPYDKTEQASDTSKPKEKTPTPAPSPPKRPYLNMHQPGPPLREDIATAPLPTTDEPIPPRTHIRWIGQTALPAIQPTPQSHFLLAEAYITALSVAAHMHDPIIYRIAGAICKDLGVGMIPPPIPARSVRRDSGKKMVEREEEAMWREVDWASLEECEEGSGEGYFS